MCGSSLSYPLHDAHNKSNNRHNRQSLFRPLNTETEATLQSSTYDGQGERGATPVICRPQDELHVPV